MLTITKKLDISPRSVPHSTPQVINLSQYDSDFEIQFKLYASTGTFTIEEGTTAAIKGTKPSGTGYSADASIDIETKTVTVSGDVQMTAAAGRCIYEIALYKDNKEINSANFILLVERAALDADTITDESVLKELNAIIESADTATQAAEEAEDAADRAEAAAESLVIDNTLTHPGQAADAKKTGDEITGLKEDLSEVEDFFVPIDSGVSVGALTTGSYIIPSTGATSALAYGCRSNYVDIIVSGTSAWANRRVPLMFVAGFDRTIYKYTIYGYSTHSVSSASESFTGGTWTQRERVFILPKNAETKCFRFSAIRIDGQGTITEEQAAEIASNIKIMRMTDADLAKAGVPADALATREAIAALEAKTFPNSAKKFAFFGDSLMWGRDGNSASAQAQVAKPIPAVVAERLGVVADNYGVGGMGWVRIADHAGHPETNAYGMISSTDLSDYDYIVMDFGVNDGYRPIGEWNSVDETTVAGQINKCIDYLKTTYPTIIPIVVAPWNGCNVGSYPDYWYGDVTGPTNAGMRYSRQELRNVEARICQNVWITFIDVYDSPINGASITEALPDGVHASADYYIKIGEWLAGKIGGLIR